MHNLLASLLLSAISFDESGHAHFTAYTPEPFTVVRVQRSTDLETWNDLAWSVSDLVDGSVEFIDEAPPADRAFYRLVVVPPV